jgi:hypothetical protein
MVDFLKYHDGIWLDGKTIREYEASVLKFVLSLD